MIITDIGGQRFEITDIDGTIKMLDAFLSYHSIEKFPSLKRLEDRRVLYWNDFRDKLMEVKSRFNTKV